MVGQKRKTAKDETSDSEVDSEYEDTSSDDSVEEESSKEKTKKQQASNKRPKKEEREVKSEILGSAGIEERVTKLNSVPFKIGDANRSCVVYWMSRDQRIEDNWALLYAQKLAKEREIPLVIVFTLVEKFLNAGFRQFIFMLKGLKELEKKLHEEYNIPFVLLKVSEPSDGIIDFLERNPVYALVTDFSPLRISRTWKSQVSKKVQIPFYEVDAHNIVPVWKVSNKLEFAARTIRPKIHKQLPYYLTEFPKVEKNDKDWKGDPKDNKRVDWDSVLEGLSKTADMSITELTWCKPGTSAAKQVLSNFLERKLRTYADERNDPNKDAQSNLSPYLHFGQISAQRVVLEARNNRAKGYDAFIEELVVRRELSDNFCYYNQKYDSFDGFPDWAKKTLNEHKNDKREKIYSLEELEKGKTYDKLWNASQMEMVHHGKMHGFMRMYWAKKILEWSKDPQEALKHAIHLNDKYQIDGRDPNGYVGCAWSVGGVHDRPWTERNIFGKIRYMNYEGCKRKFDVNRYIARFQAKIR